MLYSRNWPNCQYSLQTNSTGKQGVGAQLDFFLAGSANQVVLRIYSIMASSECSSPLGRLDLPTDTVCNYRIAFDCLVFSSYLSEQEHVSLLITGCPAYGAGASQVWNRKLQCHVLGSPDESVDGLDVTWMGKLGTKSICDDILSKRGSKDSWLLSFTNWKKSRQDNTTLLDNTCPRQIATPIKMITSLLCEPMLFFIGKDDCCCRPSHRGRELYQLCKLRYKVLAKYREVD